MAKRAQKDLLLELIGRESVEWFHDSAQRAYVSFNVNGTRVTALVSSAIVRSWLIRLLFESMNTVASAETLAAVRGLLEARARFDGATREVAVRVAGSNGRVFLDLGDETWSVAEVDAYGWRVRRAEDVPVTFRRPPGLLPLPTPVAGGKLTELKRFTNANSDELPLIVGWLVSALRPWGPYPVLVLQGEQGSGKSTAARLLRRLIDPNRAEIRSQPREDRELAIAASNGWILAFDNLSGVPGWLSDALCRISTGGGFATRALYTDSEEALFDAQRPILLNGIESPASRADLLDRSLLVTLPRLESVRLEREFWAAFEEARARLLGALLDAVSTAIRRQADVPPTNVARLRMSDAAAWVSAAEPALPWQPGEFLEAYRLNRRDAADLAVDASIVATLLVEVVDKTVDGMWSGTAGELLAEIDALVGEKSPVRGVKDWPKSPRAMAAALARLAPALRQTGIQVEMPRPVGRHRRRVLHLQRVPQTSSTSSAGTTETADDEARRGTRPDDIASDLCSAVEGDQSVRSRTSCGNHWEKSSADDADDLLDSSRPRATDGAVDDLQVEGEL